MGVRSNTGVAYGQIKQNRSGNNRHQAITDRQPDVVLFQPPHHAAGRVQPPRTATGQQNRVYPVHQVAGVQQIGLTRARRGTAHVHAAYCARAVRSPRDDDRAARGTARVGEVADFNAGDLGD